MLVKDRVHISIAKRSGNVLKRSDLSDLGGSTQLSAALRALVKSGKLIRLTQGLYAKARQDSHGHAVLAAPEQQVAQEVSERLGVEARITHTDPGRGAFLYVLTTSPRRDTPHTPKAARPARRARGVRLLGPALKLPVDVDLLPKKDVGAYVRRLAEANRVVHQRSRLDDWAEAVTRVAGDEVRLDHTEKLLMELTKKHIVSGRQAARLLNNYMEEKARVRPVQRLSNRRVSAKH